MPLVSSLGNNHLKPTHWNEIFEILTGKVIDKFTI
jgi:hypothetical protein